jgi:hypothetical protein
MALLLLLLILTGLILAAVGAWLGRPSAPVILIGVAVVCLALAMLIPRF